MKSLTAVLAMLLVSPSVLAACQAESGAARARILELYTSEGCSSCPPADRWMAALSPTTLARAGWIPLAFHVDYWDRLGWKDRFAQPEFSQRQRARASKLGWVYTPQFLHDGESIRPVGQTLPVSDGAVGARLALTLKPATDALVASANATLLRPVSGARLYFALYENDLRSKVAAGENAGRTLTHAYVVRELAGPFAVGQVAHRFTLAPDWERHALGVAAWVETPDGESLQAVAASGCQSAR